MNSSSSLRVQGELKYTNNQQSPTPKVANFKFLRLVTGDTSLKSEFSQVWVLYEFQLGNELASYSLDGIEDNSSFLYLKLLPNVINLPSGNPKSNSLLAIRTAPVDSRSITQLWPLCPLIQQQNSPDCSATYLAMVSQYWDTRLSLNSLRNLAAVKRMGAFLQDLAEAAQTLGYEVLSVRASLSKLDSYYNLWIVHWQGIYYVVV
ncbi:cysteine peptidase family C39 domain-containing protein [Nostoc sp. MG11]|uniref:cysteine peptidase family C39 domain-containing protein n=1 Tax=Nostoc sp. MG11 TaxID=2721166 RepID=UPI001D0299CC|nr:cysteine peptidase family C39 domain-containing protein [Nostoc sp. MG11]